MIHDIKVFELSAKIISLNQKRNREAGSVAHRLTRLCLLTDPGAHCSLHEGASDPAICILSGHIINCFYILPK